MMLPWYHFGLATLFLLTVMGFLGALPTGWMCSFNPCRWTFLFNANTGQGLPATSIGLFQCRRCKAVSIGGQVLPTDRDEEYD